MSSSKRYKLWVRIFWTAFALPVVFLIILFSLIAGGHMGFMPTFEELENPKSNLASEIIAADGQLLGKYYKENRTVVSFEDVSPLLVNALIATEDIRFHKHSGIDKKALFRVAWGVLTGNRKGGGSTLSQQLAKNLFKRDTTNYDSKFKRIKKMALTKFKEWVIAVKLERNYTKEEIMAMYLNTVDFGSMAFGIKSAARTFFNTTPEKLTLEQAALLVGVLKAPSRYSPVLNPDNALARREVVLQQMLKYDFINQATFDSINAIPIELDYNVQSHNKGLSTYFREYLRMAMTAHKPKKENYPDYMQRQYEEDLLEWKENPLYGWCNKNKKPDGKPYDLYKDGLKIYTTIDAKMQQYAEEAVEEHLKGYLQPMFFKKKKNRDKGPFSWRVSDKQIERIIYQSMRRSERYRVLSERGLDSAAIAQNFRIPTQMKVFTWRGDSAVEMSPLDSIWYYKYYLNAGFISMEPQSGYVRAYVGGINYRHFKYDHVKLAKRQVGSTFKPFVYTMGILNGLQPCELVPNIPHTIPMPDGQPPFTPRFSANKRGSHVTLKRGLASSYNHISAWVMKRLSPEKVIELTRKMGVKSYIDPVPSICVGAAEVTLYELVGAYSAFVNQGMYTQPIFATRIEDKNGNTIATFHPNKIQAFDETTAWVMLQMLRGVVQSGTSTRLWSKYKLKNEIAGKTGTTNNNSDGWFIGLTPNLISGVWVGGEVRSIHFDSGYLGEGASMALPIWALYMQKVYADKTLVYSRDDKFQRPNHPVEIELNCSEYRQEHGMPDDQNGGDEFFK